jgi:pilus assembly protein CpaF
MAPLLNRIEKKAQEPTPPKTAAAAASPAAPAKNVPKETEPLAAYPAGRQRQEPLASETQGESPSGGDGAADSVTDAELRAKWQQLRQWAVERVMSGLPSAGELTRTPQTTRLVIERLIATLQASNLTLPPAQQAKLESEVISEILGFGPLDPLLADPAVTEIMANGPDLVFVEKQGRIQETPVRFNDEAHMMRIVERIIRPLGRRIDRKWPMVDARLPDGSRVNVIIPPSSIDGPALTIRKFSQKKLTAEDLIQFGSLTPGMAEFLRACVVSRLNIIVAGGTGSGKTTLLNVLSNFIPDDDRIVTIEDSAELQLNRRHVVRLETKPPDVDGTGRVTIRDLVINALRMRPDRIVVGECRSAEALDMLQAMNTGHDGSLTTLHANTPRDVISRLETMSLMAGLDLPVKVVREQIAAAIDVIIQQSRLRDGSRKIVQVTEVQGMEGEVVVLQDIFRFVERRTDTQSRVIGEILPTGIRPKFTPRLEVSGFDLPPEVFGAVPLPDSHRRR